MITDCHLHIIDRAALDYPWLGGVPALDRDWLYETYTREARRLGITKVLHMEVDVAPAEMELETAYVQGVSRRLTALREPSLIRGAIAACRPEDKDFPEYLERALANPFVKGFRRVLHVVPDDVSEGALFRENLKRLSGTRLTFDLCTLPHQIGKAIALADLNPDVNFILDHCGVPDIASEAHEGWAKGIAEIAKRPNVRVKLSGIVAYADAGSWTVETLRPYVATVLDTFGPSRMLWGSDWPVVTLGGTLSTWVAATHALLADLADGEREAILSGNAARLWSI
jgi:predicted TIM-barrel fold metal-dependent hydrolase